MKAVTLYQPYATLVAIGAKKIESRSWGTKYLGPLAIHASKKQPKWCRELERESPFKEALYPNGNYLYPWTSCGCILAICELSACWPIDDRGNGPFSISGQERAFGDYTPGRVMWVLENVRELKHPIPAKGALGLWEWSAPGALEFK